MIKALRRSRLIDQGQEVFAKWLALLKPISEAFCQRIFFRVSLQARAAQAVPLAIDRWAGAILLVFFDVHAVIS